MLKKLAAILLVFSLLLSFASCIHDDSDSDSDTPPADDNTTPPADDDPPEVDLEYTVKLVTPAGLGIEGVHVYVHKSDAEFDVVGLPLITDANGEVKLTLSSSKTYSVQFDKLPERYVLADGQGPHGRHLFDGTTAVVVVGYNPDYRPSVYSLGDNIADFTVTDVYGNTHKLSELLSTKKMVMINLWFTGCGPCKAEFPAINSAYNKYSSDVEILAISDYSTDSVEKVKNYPKNNGLSISFPLCYDRNLFSPLDFGSQYYPTTVIIDRYGTICMIEVGSVTSSALWDNLFAYFTSDDYQQRLFDDIQNIPSVN